MCLSCLDFRTCPAPPREGTCASHNRSDPAGAAPAYRGCLPRKAKPIEQYVTETRSKYDRTWGCATSRRERAIELLGRHPRGPPARRARGRRPAADLPRRLGRERRSRPGRRPRGEARRRGRSRPDPDRARRRRGSRSGSGAAGTAGVADRATVLAGIAVPRSGEWIARMEKMGALGRRPNWRSGPSAARGPRRSPISSTSWSRIEGLAGVHLMPLGSPPELIRDLASHARRAFGARQA